MLSAPDSFQASVRRMTALADGAPELDSADGAQPQADRLAQLLAVAFRVPVCLISGFSDTEQQVYGGCGLEAGTRLPRSDSLCAGVFDSDSPLLLADAREDARFAGNVHVTGPFGLRFYAGVPLHDVSSERLGVLCLIDTVPRPDLGAEVLERLDAIGRLVALDLAARVHREALLAERTLLLRGPTAAMVWACGDRFDLLYRSDNLVGVLGEAAVRRLDQGDTFESLILPGDRDDFRNALRSHQLTELPQLEVSFRIAAGDGALRWVRQSTRVVQRGAGRRRRVHAYLSDETRQKRLESSVAAAKDRLFLAIQSARLGTWDLDLRTMERVLSARSAEIIGFPLEEIDTHQDFWLDRVHPFDRAALLALSSQSALPGHEQTNMLEYRVRHREGHYVWVQSHAKVVESDTEGRPSRVVGTMKDVTEQRQQEVQRNRQRQLLDVLNRAQAGFLLTRDMHDACEDLFEPLLRLTESSFGFIGVLRQDGDAAPYLLVPTISNISWDAGSRALHERHRDRSQGLRFHDLDNLFGHVVTADTVVCTNDPASHPASRGFPAGHPTLHSFLGLPVRFNGKVVGMIALGNRPEGFDTELVQLLEPLAMTLGALIHARDLDLARQRAEAELQRRATTDELTGLANRRTFLESAATAMARSARDGTPLALAVVDLDHFKRVNDTHGHGAGDAVLQRFSRLAEGSVREVDLVARLGGEEFAVLMHDCTVAGAAVPLHRLRIALQDSRVAYPGGEVSVTMSAGVAAWNGPGMDIRDWLAASDRALYAAKAGGRNAIWLDGTPPQPMPMLDAAAEPQAAQR